MSLTWNSAYARQKSAEREQARSLANDPAMQAKSRRYAKRFGAACKQTRGNIKAAVALMAEWEAADLVAADREPVRTLVLSNDGDPEPVCHEEDA